MTNLNFNLYQCPDGGTLSFNLPNYSPREPWPYVVANDSGILNPNPENIVPNSLYIGFQVNQTGGIFMGIWISVGYDSAWNGYEASIVQSPGPGNNLDLTVQAYPAVQRSGPYAFNLLGPQIDNSGLDMNQDINFNINIDWQGDAPSQSVKGGKVKVIPMTVIHY